MGKAYNRSWHETKLTWSWSTNLLIAMEVDIKQKYHKANQNFINTSKIYNGSWHKTNVSKTLLTPIPAMEDDIKQNQYEFHQCIQELQ